MKRERNGRGEALIWLFAVTYMVSYMTRINFGAVISEMVTDLQWPRSLVAAALTGSFITYGAGQVVSGICGDRLSPKKLVLCGLGATVLMNLLIPLCWNPVMMAVVWSVNGFAQAFLWPPLVRLMTTLFAGRDYDRAVVRVSWGSSFGTILVYLLAPVVILLTGWRGVFVCSAVCGAVMLLIWNRFCPETEMKMTLPRQEKTDRGAGFFSPMMLGIMTAVMLQGMLRDGVTTWMPSYIAETYDLSNEIAILTGVLLPLFSILCFQVASSLYCRWFANPLVCAGVIFSFGALSALLLFVFSGRNPAFSVLLSAALTGAMHGVNLLLVSMIPPFFKKYGNVATVSGVINSCTYVGSAASTYGIAVMSEKMGWGITLVLWTVIAAVGTVVCLVVSRPWNRRFCDETNSNSI